MPTSGASMPGFVGGTNNSQLFIGNISVGGSNFTPAALVTANNGILGGWAVVENTALPISSKYTQLDFASYNATYGVGSLGSSTNYGSYTIATAGLANAASTLNMQSGAITFTNSASVNSFNVTGAVTDSGSLDIISGGLIISPTPGNSYTFGGTGTVTAGPANVGGELDVFTGAHAPLP